jgi:hypothetical protein
VVIAERRFREERIARVVITTLVVRPFGSYQHAP